jgi:hypothetical protein
MTRAGRIIHDSIVFTSATPADGNFVRLQLLIISWAQDVYKDVSVVFQPLFYTIES